MKKLCDPTVVAEAAVPDTGSSKLCLDAQDTNKGPFLISDTGTMQSVPFMLIGIVEPSVTA